MVLEMRGVVPPHVQRGGGGGAAHKKRGGPLPPGRFFWTRGYLPLPVTGDSCGYRRKSTGNGGRIYGAMEGYPPVARTQGWGIPPLEKMKGGGPYSLRFFAENKEQELVESLHYEYS